MVATFSIDADGVARLAVDLELSAQAASQTVRKVVRKSTFAIERGAKLRAPVDTGFLRNSITSEFEGGGLVSEVGPEANYGIFIELGTHRMAAQPYLGPAFDEVEPSFLAAIAQVDPLAGQND